MALPNTQSAVAGGTIAPGRCIKYSTAADNTILQSTAATDLSFGIAKRSMREAPGITGADTDVAAVAGDPCEYYGPGSVAPAIAGAAFSRGTELTSDATGRLIAVAAGTNLGVVGLALESASGAGVEVQVFVHPYRKTT